MPYHLAAEVTRPFSLSLVVFDLKGQFLSSVKQQRFGFVVLVLRLCKGLWLSEPVGLRVPRGAVSWTKLVTAQLLLGPFE